MDDSKTQDFFDWISRERNNDLFRNGMHRLEIAIHQST